MSVEDFGVEQYTAHPDGEGPITDFGKYSSHDVRTKCVTGHDGIEAESP
jgi:hypothetical protein